jgi:hypothetical protein
MISPCAMPSKKKASHSEQDYGVGDRVKVNLHTGRIVDATVKAVIERTDGKRLQVDFGKDETALIPAGNYRIHIAREYEYLLNFEREIRD